MEILKLYLFTFFRSFTVFASISVAFYVQNGLNYTQVMTLQAIYAICIAVLEVPSGMMSDKLGRKNTLMVGSVGFLISYTCGLFGHSLVPFVFMQIFAAVGQSSYSGTFLARMFEDIRRSNDKNLNPNVIYANMQTVNLISGLLASGFCVLVVKYISMRATYFFTVVAYIITCVITLSLKKDVENIQKTISYKHILKESIDIIKKDNNVLLYLDLIIFTIMANGLLYLQQPLLIERSFATEYFGAVTITITLITTAILKNVKYLDSKLHNKLTASFVSVLLIGCIFLSNVFIKNSIWVIVSYVLLSGAIRLRDVFITTEINLKLDNSCRATVMSFISGVEMLGYAVISMLIGWLADKSINLVLVVMSLVLVITYVVLFIFRKSREILKH
jgi:MFS family permease